MERYEGGQLFLQLSSVNDRKEKAEGENKVYKISFIIRNFFTEIIYSLVYVTQDGMW